MRVMLLTRQRRVDRHPALLDSGPRGDARIEFMAAMPYEVRAKGLSCWGRETGSTSIVNPVWGTHKMCGAYGRVRTQVRSISQTDNSHSKARHIMFAGAGAGAGAGADCVTV